MTETMHFAAGGSASAVATAGFNLVDVQTVEQLNELPDGIEGPGLARRG